MNGPACWFLWYYCLWTFLYIAITEIFEHLIKYDLGRTYIQDKVTNAVTWGEAMNHKWIRMDYTNAKPEKNKNIEVNKENGIYYKQ